jgi:NADH:ubiquinone oxidoreductase subunit 2 (subunit N)
MKEDLIRLFLFDGSIKTSTLKIYWELFIFLLSLSIILVGNNLLKATGSGKLNEINLILMTNLLGSTLILFSNDFLLTIISWELFNISLYLLVSCSFSPVSNLTTLIFSTPGLIVSGTEGRWSDANNSSLASSFYSGSSYFTVAASLKYILLSALSTAFLLLGISILYLLTGNTNYDIIAICIEQFSILGSSKSLFFLQLAFFFIISSLFFKLSAAPFYNWAPDLYDNLYTNISMWMMIIPKLVIMILIQQFSAYFFIFPAFGATFPSILFLFSGILSLIIGSIALFSQWNIKRFLAYSSISHIGFILLSLYIYDYHSYIIYVFIYTLTTLNIFLILSAFINYLGHDIKFISDLIGLFRLNPFLNFAFVINFLSLAGNFYVCRGLD